MELHRSAVQVVFPSQRCCFFVGIVLFVILHLVLSRQSSKIRITVGKSKVVVTKVLVSIFAEHLAQLALVKLDFGIGVGLVVIAGKTFAIIVLVVSIFLLCESGFSLRFSACVLLFRDCLDLLATLEKLNTALHLSKKFSLSLETNDHLFSFSSISVVLVPVEAEAFLVCNPDSITVDFEAAAI